MAANFPHLTRQEMDHLLELVLSKTTHLSLDMAKKETIAEVSLQIAEITGVYVAKREKLDGALTKFKIAANKEQMRIQSLKESFQFDMAVIDGLLTVCTIATTSAKLLKIPKNALEFAIKNKKLVFKELPFYPSISHFEARISAKVLTKAMIREMVQTARKDPIGTLIDVLNLGINSKSFDVVYRKIFGTSPTIEMKKSLDNLNRNLHKVKETTEQKVTQFDQIIDELNKKYKDAVRYINGISHN